MLCLEEGRERTVALCVCIFLQHGEPKPSTLMGWICKFTPANSAFPGFLCASSLFMHQRAACTCSILPARQAARIKGQFALWHQMPHPAALTPFRGY